VGEDQAEELIAFVPPLLQALERLAFAARHVHPPQLGELVEALGRPEEPLIELRPKLDAWPAPMAWVRDALGTAADAAIEAFTALRGADEMGGVYRALGQLPRAEEALYPLARGLPPVSRYFLDPSLRQDAARADALAAAEPREDTGVLHLGGEPGGRGTVSLYVPEDYSAERAWPVVFALHGGSGNGRRFLWSWLRDARSFGAIVVAPTAVGRTWALQGPDADTPNLARILEAVRGHWNVDPGRIVLSGMSDGGTFALVSGLEPGSPFTHLAPVSTGFPPMMAGFADKGRLEGLPIFLAHGARS
jgi:phospholipase/carboxylesterase